MAGTPTEWPNAVSLCPCCAYANLYAEPCPWCGSEDGFCLPMDYIIEIDEKTASDYVACFICWQDTMTYYRAARIKE